MLPLSATRYSVSSAWNQRHLSTIKTNSKNWQQVFPDLITYRNYNYSAGKNMPRTAKIKSVDVEGLIPVLVASIKEQQLEIEKLKTEIQALKKQEPSTVLK
jgi:hypothetical protein